MSLRHVDYRSLLRDEYRVRRVARQHFSHNAFAKFLGLTPSHLADVFKKRSGISYLKGQEIVRRLQLSMFDENFFLNSILSEHSRSKSERAEAKEALEKLKLQNIAILKPDLLALVSQWQHMAIIEMVRLKGFRFSADWIAEQLDISEKLAKESMDRLLKTGLIKIVGGRCEVHKGLLKTAEDIPSHAVKSHHLQALNLSRVALYEQDIDTREFSTLFVAFDQKRLLEAKKRIRQFQSEMSELLTTSAKDRDSLYCFSMQLFSLLSKSKGKR